MDWVAVPAPCRLTPRHVRDLCGGSGTLITPKAKVEAEFAVFMDAQDVNELGVYFHPVKVFQHYFSRFWRIYSHSVFLTNLQEVSMKPVEFNRLPLQLHQPIQCLPFSLPEIPPNIGNFVRESLVEGMG